MNRIALTGLCKIELPSATIRLCDGGRIVWGSEVFTARSLDFGTIGSLEALAEGAQDELPPFELMLLPPSTAAAADLVQPTMQGSRVRFWIAEYSVATGQVTGTPDLRFDGELDQATLTQTVELALTIVSAAARLFESNIGNSLSSSFHKSVWPGETGHDQATGLGRPIAWGVEAPVQSFGTGSGSASAQSLADMRAVNAV